MVRSILRPCTTIRDIGQFVLLDIDVSGIPTDAHGLVRPGLADTEKYEHYDADRPGVSAFNGISDSLSNDVTCHIEADWDGDPNTMLFCVRYNGRRITTINPALADFYFCSLMFRPTPSPLVQADEATLEWTLQDCLNRRPLPENDCVRPYIMKAHRSPRLCYAALAWYKERHTVFLASNCLATSIKDAQKVLKPYGKSRAINSYMLIVGLGDFVTTDDWPPTEIEEEIQKLRSKQIKGTGE